MWLEISKMLLEQGAVIWTSATSESVKSTCLLPPHLEGAGAGKVSGRQWGSQVGD